MTYILLASDDKKILHQASAYLLRNDIRIVVENKKENLFKHIEREEPRVLFVEDFLHEVFGIDVIDHLRKIYEFGYSNIIYAGNFREVNVPIIDWSWYIDSFVQKPYSSWQVVLSVEQCLYRKITPNGHLPPDFADIEAEIEALKKRNFRPL